MLQYQEWFSHSTSLWSGEGGERQRNALQVAKNGLKIKVGSDALLKHSTVIVTLTSGLNREYIGTFPAPYVMLPLPMVLSLSAVP